MLLITVRSFQKHSFIQSLYIILDKGFTVGAILVILFILSMVSVYYMQLQDMRRPVKEGFMPLATDEEDEEKPVVKEMEERLII